MGNNTKRACNSGVTWPQNGEEYFYSAQTFKVFILNEISICSAHPFLLFNRLPFIEQSEINVMVWKKRLLLKL